MAKEYDYEMEGLRKVQDNLNKEIDKIKNKSQKGINKAALLVERESKKKTPVDTGNLKGATFTEPIQTSDGPGAIVGYEEEGGLGIPAEYAIHVHERTELHHDNGEAKFLEKALKQNTNKILQILKRNAEVR